MNVAECKPIYIHIVFMRVTVHKKKVRQMLVESGFLRTHRCTDYANETSNRVGWTLGTMDENTISFWQSASCFVFVSPTGRFVSPSSIRVSMVRSWHCLAFPKGYQAISYLRTKMTKSKRRKRDRQRKRQTYAVVHFPRSHERAGSARAKGKRPSCIPISTK